MNVNVIVCVSLYLSAARRRLMYHGDARALSSNRGSRVRVRAVPDHRECNENKIIIGIVVG